MYKYATTTYFSKKGGCYADEIETSGYGQRSFAIAAYVMPCETAISGAWMTASIA
jgi:hypothetical protein